MSVTEPNKRMKGTCAAGTPKMPAEDRAAAQSGPVVSNPRPSMLRHTSPPPKGTRANARRAH